MSRWPIRWKVTGAFALSLLVVLVAVGAFVYLRFDGELSRALDRGLRVRSSEVSAEVATSELENVPNEPVAFPADEHVVQVLRGDGSIVVASVPTHVSLLDAAQRARAQVAPTFFDRPGDAAIDERLRLLASPVQRGGEKLIAVVGSTEEDNSEALQKLLILLVIGLGGALGLASVAGFVVAGSALRPVEAMRQAAAEITDSPDQRLPVPRVDDEIGRLGSTLNAMLARLDRAQESEHAAIARDRQFVEDASHELRTPLTVLKSELEVALVGDRDSAELRAALLSALEETDRLCKLSEDLLLLAQSDEKTLVLHREQLGAADVVETVVARARRQPSADGRDIRTDASAALVVNADRARLEQALANLVDNALRHGAGTIEVAARYDGPGVIEFAVHDHGNGFPAGFAGRAFERFSRADAGRTGGGTGLGLSIVLAVAEAHGGSVRVVDGTPGARVVVSLPLS